MPLLLPNWNQQANSENAPAFFQKALKEGYGDWAGDPSLTFWVDPDGTSWAILQQVPHQGWIEIYSSSPGEKITEHIFRHLSQNHWTQAQANLEKALKAQEKIDDDKLTQKAEEMGDAIKKALFYHRQTSGEEVHLQ